MSIQPTGARAGATTIPFGFDGREIRIAMLGWGLFILAQGVYCTVYTHVVATTSWDARDMLTWALTEWGIWLVLTPLVFRTARRHESWLAGHWSRHLALAGCALAISLPVRVAMEVFATGRDAAPSFVVYLPRHAAAITAILLVWRYLLRPTPAISTEILDAPVEPHGSNGREAAAPETLLVSKGRDECLIRVDGIQSVTASGNYVEIICDNQLYMLRATMKQLAALLPAATFLRVHRCHMVNIHQIDRIIWQRSGNGTIRLKCGRTVNISKSYKSELHRRGTW